MNEITDFMLEYRKCCKLIWNDFYKKIVSYCNDSSFNDYWDRLDSFRDLEVRLFSILVLSKAGVSETTRKSPSYIAQKNVLNCIRVRIKVPNARVAIQRVKSQGTYWDHPINVLSDNQADLRFIDFFDFDTQCPLQYEYCLVRIMRSTAYPEIAGHDALIEVGNCVMEALDETDFDTLTTEV